MDVFRKTLRSSSNIDDSREPMKHRTSVLVAASGIICLVVFCMRAGMLWWDVRL